MRIITRTVYGAQLQTNHLLNKPHELVPNTTLNEKFDVQSGVTPSDTQRPALEYYCLGVGGHKNMTGADGFEYTSPLNHLASNAALYRHVPFVLRETDNDLSVEERSKYGMRRLETYNERQYYAYYLKRLDLDNVAPEMHHTAINEGVPTTTTFTPTSANLNPQPPELPSDGVITTSGDYLSTTATVPIEFTAQDVDEYVNAIRIIYGNENYAIISEMGLVTGVDKLVTGPAHGGATLEYVEVLGAQVHSFITCHYSVGFTNQGFNFEVELGMSEPLIGEGDEPVIV